jgi:TM2 domain-containing membrane protein YozV
MAFNNDEYTPEYTEPTPIHPVPPEPQVSIEGIQSKRIIVAVFAMMTGAFGVHKFILGQTQQGFIRLGITFLLIWTLIAPITMMVIGMAEAVIYFTKTDEEFIRTYQVGRKDWF